MFDACTTGDTAHIDTIFKFLPHTRQHVEACVAIQSKHFRPPPVRFTSVLPSHLCDNLNFIIISNSNKNVTKNVIRHNAPNANMKAEVGLVTK
jgi:hypothetical protein